ncbi:hypothetical protein HII17_13245 [Thalassotalea sp. M1531]|uniref:Uncharacterized protein n=1 Tax=Thalassotalea algicola TaxID=2716224 RepID=A0A7Y0LDG0_9GAMM|nr:hypothetical protein [Thalassotalea algicola]NMP32529.1 hypothetical protein [Thalassotalea algicola]
MRKKQFLSLISLNLLLTPYAMASDPSGLMVIFIPGLVFLVVGSFAVSYALTTAIENYWLKFSLRIFSIAIIVTPSQVGGAGYWWPNGIALLFYDQLNISNAAFNTMCVTLAFVSAWWLIKRTTKI